MKQARDYTYWYNLLLIFKLIGLFSDKSHEEAAKIVRNRLSIKY